MILQPARSGQPPKPALERDVDFPSDVGTAPADPCWMINSCAETVNQTHESASGRPTILYAVDEAQSVVAMPVIREEAGESDASRRRARACAVAVQNKHPALFRHVGAANVSVLSSVDPSKLQCCHPDQPTRRPLQTRMP